MRTLHFTLATASAVAATLAIAGCGGDSTGPAKPGPAAKIEAVSSTTLSGVVGTALPAPLVVHVTDAKGISVPGVAVTFLAPTGNILSVSSGVTDADGRAQAQLLLTTRAGGPFDVTASAANVGESAHFSVTATPGPLAKLAVDAHAVHVPTELDTVRVSAATQDQYGNAVSGQSIAWASRNESVMHADADGLVHVLARGTPTYVVASAGTLMDSVAISAPVSPCGGTAATAVAVGQVLTDVASSGFCLRGGTTGGDYALIPFFGSPTASATIELQVAAAGVGTPPAAARIAPLAMPTLPFRLRGLSRVSTRPRIDHTVETRLLARARDLMQPLVASARRQRAARGGLLSVAPPSYTVNAGDTVALNLNLFAFCTNPQMEGVRVVAVGTRTIVFADTANPAGGFTDAEYTGFAATFDTLVDPLDRQAFGDPTDIDGNGRVGIVFTRAVNEVAPPGGVVLGLFHPRDLLPKSSCAASNAAEMFYIAVPDPAGSINGTPLSKDLVSRYTVSALAHEYQHMINQGRRMYVNDATVGEEVWLNEGLSHVASELLFYRISGTSPRQNLGSAPLTSQAEADAYNVTQLDNFFDYEWYLTETASTGPYNAADDFAMRGSIWNFLRYLADRQGSTDGTLWYQLVNSKTAGMDNLAAVLGTTTDGLMAIFRDWQVSHFADDFVPGVSTQYTQPSWDHRGINDQWFFPSIPYPLTMLPLGADAPARVTLNGGSGIPLRFTVPPYDHVFVTVTVGGQPPPAQVMLSLVRVQ